MIKRVKLDENGSLTEIDWKATHRSALTLKAYIEAAPLGEAVQYEYHKRVMPLIEATLNKSVQMPYYGPQPYDYRYIMEGLYPSLPVGFEDLYLSFKQKIEGSVSEFSLSTHESGEFIFQKYSEEDEFGNRYELCWFED
jgi:hypothetical protein